MTIKVEIPRKRMTDLTRVFVKQASEARMSVLKQIMAQLVGEEEAKLPQTWKDLQIVYSLQGENGSQQLYFRGMLVGMFEMELGSDYLRYIFTPRGH